MIIPTFVFLILFSYYPAINAVIYSFTDWDGFSTPIFVGLQNFINIFKDPIMIQSIKNLLIWTVISLAIGLTFPFIGAELIFHLRSKKAQYWYRVLFVIPMVVPGMVNILIWQFIYEPNIGLLNTLLNSIGLPHLAQEWLSNPNIALFAIALMGFPWISGFNLLIYYAGLQNISESVIDSTRLDGAVGLKRIFKIDMPMIAGQIKLLFILGVIGGLQNLTSPLILTGGGPGYATYVPGLYMYKKAFEDGKFGYAMSVAVLLFVVIMILTYINLKYINSEVDQ